MGDTSTMCSKTRIEDHPFEIAAFKADSLTQAAFEFKATKRMLCEDCPEYSQAVIEATPFKGEIDTLAYTAVHVANKFGIPLNKMGIILCKTHLGIIHVVAFYRIPNKGIFIFGDYFQPGIYEYNELPYELNYFVNVETGAMKTMVDLKKS